VLVAVLGAALIVALAGAAGPLFLSSAGTAALRTQVSSTSSTFAGLAVNSEGPLASDRLAYRSRLLAAGVRGLVDLGPPVITLDTTQTSSVRGRGAKALETRPTSRTGFLSHLDVVARTSGGGWWLAQTIAGQLHIHPGDTVTLLTEARAPVQIRIAGVYRDLLGKSPTPYWNPLYDLIYPSSNDPLAPPPPPLLLAEQPTLLALEDRLANDGEMRWEYPLDTRGMPLPEAKRLGGALTRFQARMEDPLSPLAGAFGEHTAGLPTIEQQAEATVAALAGSVNAVAFAGRLVALLVFAVAGVYGVHRRRVEFSALQARGMSPVRLGAKSVLEVALPAAAGAAVGFLAALAIVRTLGPAREVAPEAMRAAILSVAVAAAVGLFLVGLVVALTARAMAMAGSGRVRRAAAKFPWELAALLLAGAALWEILGRAPVPLVGGQAVPKVDLLLPLFPVLFVAGTGGLAVRGLQHLLPKLRSAGRGRSAPVYLALRRLASAPRVALLLVTASVLAVGVLVYAGVLVSTVRATVVEKSEVFVGSDTSISVTALEPLPPGARATATVVARIPGGAISPGQQQVNVLGIDPASFARGAFWDPGLAGTPLEDILHQLGGQAGGPVPALAVAGTLPANPKLDLSGFGVALRVIGEARGFPGMLGGRPLVVVSTAALNRALGRLNYGVEDFGPTYQVWVKGPVAPVQAALKRAGILPNLIQSAVTIESTPAFLALRWTFGFLEALGILAGAVALIGLLLYLAARQGSREVSYALASRMGLSRRAHRLSVAIELGGMLLAAFVVGAVLAAVAALIVYRRTDLLPQVPPGPLFRLPLVLFAGAGLGAAGFAWLGAWGVQRRADRANIAEVMRLAG
jgi:putative ABC transport system permease protein